MNHLRDQARSILNKFVWDNFSLTFSDFEKLVLSFYCFRTSVASYFAKLQNQDYIPASNLFFGGICLPKFKNFRFQPDDIPRCCVSSSIKGVWCKSIKNLKTWEVKFEDDNIPIDLTRSEPYAILLGDNNIFDGVLNYTILNYGNTNTLISKSKAILWIDTKFDQRSSNDTLDPLEIEKLINKRLEISKLKPEFIHLLLIVTSKRSPNAEKILKETKDDFTCIIDKDSFNWTLSPTLNSMITDELTEEDDKNNSKKTKKIK